MRNIRIPSTATLTSVDATTVALGRAVEDRQLTEVRPGPHLRDLVTVAEDGSFAFDDHEERVAGLALPDEIDPRGELGGLRVAGDGLSFTFRAA